jgi:hypothetical protein
MNIHKRAISTFYLQGLSSISREIILEKLVPVMELHPVTMDDDVLFFQGQTVSRNRIVFEQVVYIVANSDYVDVVVRDGHVYILSVKCLTRAYLQFHNDIDTESEFENQLKELIGIAHDTLTGLDEAHARKKKEGVKK